MICVHQQHEVASDAPVVAAHRTTPMLVTGEAVRDEREECLAALRRVIQDTPLSKNFVGVVAIRIMWRHGDSDKDFRNKYDTEEGYLAGQMTIGNEAEIWWLEKYLRDRASSDYMLGEAFVFTPEELGIASDPPSMLERVKTLAKIMTKEKA